MKAKLVGLALLVSGSGLMAAEEPATESVALMERLVGAGGVWELTADQFMSEYKGLGFRWTSAAKESARADGKSVTLGAYGKRVGETIVLFQEGAPKQLQVSFYNRGDDGEITEDRFEALLGFWVQKLTEVTKVPGVRRGRDNKSAVRTEGTIWSAGATAYLLESSVEKRPFRPEFIRLRVARIVKKGFMEEKLAKEERTVRADLPANVVRKDGDVFIEGIPMVDQGQKGYCVAAATARVFAYYGMQVDQHEIAQIADSSAAQGTNTRNMIEALDRVAGRFKVRVKTHSELEYMTLKDLTEDYNRQAKKAGKKELPDDPYAANLWDNLNAFEGDLLKELRAKDKSGIRRFKTEIQNSIDIGVPLLWTLYVGMFPEPKLSLQAKGGHMRMIIGYNWDKDEIIYSDSWGAGHEFKRWGVAEAYCATTGLYSVLPTK